MSYEWNPFFQYLRRNFTSEDLRRMRRRAGRKASARKDRPAISNGDMIRRMSDEELAEFLVSEDAQACSHCEYYDNETQRCYLDNPCVTELACVMLLDWLSSKAEPLPESERSRDKEG